MHETWQDARCYLAPSLLRCTSMWHGLFLWLEPAGKQSYSSTASEKHTKYPTYSHLWMHTYIVEHARMHSWTQAPMTNAPAYAFLSDCSVSRDYIFLTSPPWHCIVSRFAGSACKAWSLLAGEVKWAAITYWWSSLCIKLPFCGSA